MTAPSPDPYIAEAQQRVLTPVEKGALDPIVALVLIRNRVEQLRTSGAPTSIAGRILLGIRTDMDAVIEQMKGGAE